MGQMQGKSSGSKRKWSLRQWYQVRRLTAFALSAAMIFGNVGNSAAIAFAGEGYGGNVQFQMDAENIWNAAEEAVSTQSSMGGGIFPSDRKMRQKQEDTGNCLRKGTFSRLRKGLTLRQFPM